MHAIIMAGGSGTRFWPASRRLRPKQLLPLAHGKSLLRATIERVRALTDAEHTWIVTNAEFAGRLGEAMPDFPVAQLLIEPEPRDTAPCVAFATACIEARDPGATMAFLPADHVVPDAARFVPILRRAAVLAADRTAVATLGVRPTHATTAYGYIERGAAIDTGTPLAFAARSFREKPDRPTASEFVATGRFLWNAGVFAWNAAGLLAAMDASHPQLAACTRAMFAASARGDHAAVAAAFARTPRTSVDYAVMERAPNVIVVEADLAWNDLGSFLSLDAVAPTDAAGNVTALFGGARAIAEGTERCVLYAEGPRTIAAFGVHDLVVVAVGDAVLVCPRDRADDLKQLVQRLRERGMADLL